MLFFQAEDGIRDLIVTGVQTCALPISRTSTSPPDEASLLTFFTNARRIVFARWSGTRRMLTLATTFAGITVLDPAPVHPPAIPWASSVGRAHRRSKML